jgi:ABC-type amino acid transport substrate-binding protein
MPDHYRLLSDALQAVQVGIAFEKDTTDEVVEELRDALASMEEDGTLQEILERYEISVDKVAYDETAGLDTSKRIGGAMR